MALAVLKPLLLLLPCLLLLLLLVVPSTRARERYLLVRLMDDDGAENNRVAKDQMGNSNGLDKNSTNVMTQIELFFAFAGVGNRQLVPGECINNISCATHVLKFCPHRSWQRSKAKLGQEAGCQ